MPGKWRSINISSMMFCSLWSWKPSTGQTWFHTAVPGGGKLLAPNKTQGPATCLTFAGIELDTVAVECRLPEEKRLKCIHTIAHKKVTLHDLPSAIELLNFACQVVLPGRAFLRRLIELINVVTQPYRHIRLSNQAKANMHTWLQFRRFS